MSHCTLKECEKGVSGYYRSQFIIEKVMAGSPAEARNAARCLTPLLMFSKLFLCGPGPGLGMELLTVGWPLPHQ